MRGRPFALVTLMLSLGATWVACASFSSSDDAQPAEDPPDAEADANPNPNPTSDAPVVDAAFVSTRQIPVSTPTELVLDGTTLYIASETPDIYSWTPGASNAKRLTSTPGPATGLRAAHDRLYFLVAGTGLHYHSLDATLVADGGADASADGGDAGAGNKNLLCKSTARTFAALPTVLVYTSAAGVTRLALDCASVLGIASSPSTVVAADGDQLLRFTADAGGGQIDSCSPGPACGDSSTTIASMLGPDVTTLLADDTRFYWATSSGVFSKLKLAGPVVAIATGQKQPRGISVSSGTIFWSNYDDGTVMSAPVGGGSSPVTVVTGLDHPHGVAATGDALFVSESGANRVLRYKRP